MARDVVDETPISSRDELVRWFEGGSKPQGPFLVGTEHEKIPFYRADLRPVPYEGRPKAASRLCSAACARPITGRRSRTAAPSSVFSTAMAAAPFRWSRAASSNYRALRSIRFIRPTAELQAHFDALAPLSEELGLGFLDLGMSPLWTRGETPVMPKQRYDIMARYMPKVGGLGLDMMFRTSTVRPISTSPRKPTWSQKCGFL